MLFAINTIRTIVGLLKKAAPSNIQIERFYNNTCRHLNMKKLSRKGLIIKPKHDSRMAFSQKQTPTRGDVEGFISQNFYESYGANVSYFSQVLVSCKNQHDKLMAAFGITKLSQDKVYLEQYLTNPIS